MGEEQKVEEKKEEEKKEEPPEDIVLKVYMHCEACAKKVEKSLRKFEGVEEVKADSRGQRVVVKAKTGVTLDPIQIYERVQKKTGRKAELISPLPEPKPPPQEQPKQQEEEKKEEPSPSTVILKVRMHCEACAQALEKRIKKIEGVESVAIDLPNEQVMVKGFVDPSKLVQNVYKKTRKQASIVKEEEKKPEDKPAEEDKIKDDETRGGEEDTTKHDDTRVGEEDKIKDEVKKSEYSAIYTDYTYTPQIFSDENPNACRVM